MRTDMTFTPRNMIVITGAGAYPRLVVEGAHAAGEDAGKTGTPARSNSNASLP